MADQERDKKARVVKNMIETLNSQKSSKFHVMLFQYYIDTERYATSALTVSGDFTPNIRETLGGFECDAFFPPEMLRPQQKEGKEVKNGAIKVKLYVNLDDIVAILAIAEEGGETTLYPTEE
jgi:hypothetical protein